MEAAYFYDSAITPIFFMKTSREELYDLPPEISKILVLRCATCPNRYTVYTPHNFYGNNCKNIDLGVRNVLYYIYLNKETSFITTKNVLFDDTVY